MSPDPRGSDYSRVTATRKYAGVENIYTGRILLWTDISAKGKWIDTARGDELDPETKAKIFIPENARPNFRAFVYVLDDTKHIFWFESVTDAGDALGPATTKRILSLLVGPEVQGDDAPDVSVSIVPEEGAFKRIISLPRLQSIIMKIGAPNADTSSPEARQRVFEKLNAAHAKNLEIKLTKAKSADRLTLTGEYEELAEVATDTGYVKATATDPEGHKVVVSTNDAPKRIYIDPAEGGSLVGRILSALGLI